MDVKGTITALITPFIHSQLDIEGLKANINYQIAQSIDGILVLGTTGERSTLTDVEQKMVIQTAVAEAKNKIPVWVGTGCNSTEQTIERTKLAKELGADVALIVTPYYNKPSQEGIFRHFEAIATKVDIPLVLYNIPGRCGVNIEPATLLRIASLPHVIGIKESSGNLNQISEIMQLLIERHAHFKVFCGDDALTLPTMALGAVGVISVVANLLPAQMVGLVNACLSGNYEEARNIHFQLLPLFKAAFIETNPIPIKMAMNLSGFAAGNCRLPLVEMKDENLTILKQQLKVLQLLKAT